MYKRLLSVLLTFLLLAGCAGQPQGQATDPADYDPAVSESGPASEGVPSAAPSEGVPSVAPSEDVPSAAPSEDVPSAAPSATVPSAAPSEDVPSAAPSAAVPSAAPSAAVPSAAPSEDVPSTAPSEAVPNTAAPESTPPQTDPVEPTTKPASKADTVEAILSSMTLEEKVGQLFFVRCPASRAVEKISTYHLGGYILFGRDFKNSAGNWLTRQQFMKQLASYQAAADIPLLIGVDEEGGTVARASRNPNLFDAKRDSPQAVYSRGGLDAIIEDTRFYNSGLLKLGINVNLAPVADVSTDPKDFIYDRTFGKDGAATADYIKAAVTAANQVRYKPGDGTVRSIGSVLKHFPGYGNNVDTHTGVAIDQRPYEQFAAEDFLPFRAGIRAGAGGVMVNHNVVVSMDPNLPASLSPEVHRILREELGFKGVIMTDDLAMDAVEAYAADGSVAVLAVLAGNDLIVTTNFEEQIPLVINAVKSGKISEDTLDQAVRRVLEWKYDLGLLSGN